MGHEALGAHMQILFYCSPSQSLLTISDLCPHSYCRMTKTTTYLRLKHFSYLLPAYVQGCHPSVLLTFTESPWRVYEKRGVKDQRKQIYRVTIHEKGLAFKLFKLIYGVTQIKSSGVAYT